MRQTIRFYDTIHAKILPFVKLVKPDASGWVDTGCGTARLAHQALERFPSTHFVLADPSEAMLEQARARFPNGEPDRLRILPAIGSADLRSQIDANAAGS